MDKEIIQDDEVRISPRTGKPIQKKYAPKTKRKSNGKNSPIIGMNGYNLKEGDNTNVMKINIALFNMKEIDLYDVEQVNQRIGEYFQLYAKYDYKPTVAGLALALNGMDRRTLYAIANDLPTGGAGYKTALPDHVANYIKKAYKMMENMWETYMNSGKINPMTGVFLGINNYKYQDVKQVNLTPVLSNNDEDTYSVDDIKKRYQISDKSDSKE